jgi:hypothetical protein
MKENEPNYLPLVIALGGRDSKEIRTKARAAGIPQSSLYRAAKKLGIVRIVSGFGKSKRSFWIRPGNFETLMFIVESIEGKAR